MELKYLPLGGVEKVNSAVICLLHTLEGDLCSQAQPLVSVPARGDKTRTIVYMASKARTEFSHNSSKSTGINLREPATEA
jgi:hypothetical protein